MQQTPIHEQHNAALLPLIPTDAKRLIEVGCSSGALAREYKKINADCHYTGVEIVREYAELAKRHCDDVLTMDIESADSEFLQSTLNSDCWIFGDSLEHLRDPWALLKNIRKTMTASGSIVACIPNGQHWSVQVRLGIGQFRYEDSGLLDRTHLRWFTRITIIEMFEACGFKVDRLEMIVFPEPDLRRCEPAIRMLAQQWGTDPDMAVHDATAFQYVLHAVPVGYTAPDPVKQAAPEVQSKPERNILGKLTSLFK